MRSDFLDVNRQRNAETSELGNSYQSHRDRVMQLITATVADLTGSAEGRCSSIVLLGSGNCLDVELAALTNLFDEIHLVDVDEAATTAAIEASGVESSPIRTHVPVDIAEPLLSLTSRDFRPEEGNREHCVNVLQHLAADNGAADIPESDVVVSLCLFSQMIDSLSHLIGQNHPAFANTLKAMRIGHLRRMLSMLRPGGVAIFVSDVVSSDTAEELNSATPETVAELMKELVNAGNFFSGTNPSTVLNDLTLLSRLPSGPDTVHTIDPWLWHIGDRVLAVYAFRIQRKLPVTEVEEVEDSEPESSADEN